MALGIHAQNAEFETAAEAVKNMKVGWNLGNTLDSFANPEKDTWFNPIGWQDWEMVWGNPITRPELMKMMRKAGFGAIRVPVTWFPHMDDEGNVDKEWMKRVHEVVDYVIDQGLYCIINVHHDTGAHDDAWIIADKGIYEQNKNRFYHLWQQIAEEFKDYDAHLLFEGYNEMLSYYGWYDEPAFHDDFVPYQIVNQFAQDFVNAVRSTGGNNLNRNLIVSTIGAIYNTWATENFQLPADLVNGHLILSIHRYETAMWIGGIKEEEVGGFIELLNSLFIQNGVPVIIGEWGPQGNLRINSEPYEYTSFFIQKMAENNIAVYPWTGPLSSGNYRNMPAFELYGFIDAMMKGYYGDWYHPTILTTNDYEIRVDFSDENQEIELTPETSVAIGDDYYSEYILELEEEPESNQLELYIFNYEDETPVILSYPITSTTTHIKLDRENIGWYVSRVAIKHIQEGELTIKLKRSVFQGKTRIDNDCYGDGFTHVLKAIRKQFVHTVEYDYLWAELNLFYDDIPLKLKNYKGIRLELAGKSDDVHIKVYGDGEQKEDYLPLTGTSTCILFNTDIFSDEINRVTLQFNKDDKDEVRVISAWLIRQDGTEEYSDLSPFHGCEITKVENYLPPTNGDANGDGTVDANDIVDIVNYSMGKPTSTGTFNEKAADMNGDGIVNIADIIQITNIIVGK